MRRNETTGSPLARPGVVAIALALIATGAFAATAAGNDDSATDESDRQAVRQSDMILGLDGAAYLPYKPSVVEWVQKELETRELYDGAIDGTLDDATKRAIAEFQERHDIHASGIPSPFTRKALRDGGSSTAGERGAENASGETDDEAGNKQSR